MIKRPASRAATNNMILIMKNINDINVASNTEILWYLKSCFSLVNKLASWLASIVSIRRTGIIYYAYLIQIPTAMLPTFVVYHFVFVSKIIKLSCANCLVFITQIALLTSIDYKIAFDATRFICCLNREIFLTFDGQLNRLREPALSNNPIFHYQLNFELDCLIEKNIARLLQFDISFQCLTNMLKSLFQHTFYHNKFLQTVNIFHNVLKICP